MLTQIKTRLAQHLVPELQMDAGEIVAAFEMPKELAHGHLAMPVFFLAKKQKKAPPLIAKEIAQKLLTVKIPGVRGVVPVGGYINFHLDDGDLFATLYDEVRKQGEKLGHSQVGRGKTVIIDYSSPNVAKPMHVGHLRATMIGQAIRNLAEAQGFRVIGLNHLGDWGGQFGKLIYAYQTWGLEYPFEQEPFESLFKLYVRFHSEAESHPEIDAKAAELFKRLEAGDADLKKMWQKFIDISMGDFNRQWARLGVRHDLVRGESFYNDRLAAVERLLRDKHLLVKSEGAEVVDLSDEKMPPCLIRKSDGASLYATRDLASAIYRMEELKVDVNLTIVGNDQQLHFKQVFSVLRRMGFAWWEQCHHISFGMYRFKNVGRMSSRKGQIIRLEDVINKAIENVALTIEGKNPDLPNKVEVANQVAIGAIVFNDLVNDRVRDVEFDWDKALSFDGDSGPYLQYVVVRCNSILKKADQNLPEKTTPLPSDEEKFLIKTLMSYEDVLAQSYKYFKPSVLAIYLLDVAAAFNQFYHKHKIIAGDPEFLSPRLALVYITREVIRSGLKVLNIECPEAM